MTVIFISHETQQFIKADALFTWSVLAETGLLAVAEDDPDGKRNSVHESHRNRSPCRERTEASFLLSGHGRTEPGPVARPSQRGIR